MIKMKKITKIAAFALAICMSAVSMTGCGDEKESRKDKRSDDKKVEQALDNADEKELEAAFEEAAVELDQEETTEAETTTEDEASYEPTEEILNADFSSGLVQIGNDVFKIGGYYTVDQFIEEFGDRYDMSVINPDGLLDPGKEGKAELVSVTDPNVIVHINYMSNSEEKSSVGDAIVYFIFAGLDTKRANACWYPQGVTYQPEDFTYSNLPEFLENLGYKKITLDEANFSLCFEPDVFWDQPKGMFSTSHYELRTKSKEKNLFGNYSIYTSSFGYNDEDAKVISFDFTVMTGDTSSYQ